ncbi:TetR/AcrR family transcriptional regulator [Nocardioidaceae bacterium SCSIO 66511]|nr:TetR/AcrR family transcriptional regulator [Nocardioidaceae bacterium SCSIO 66511]
MSDTTTRGRGRLSPERTQEVYDSVVALLVEHGYESLTMDAVAHAASISKATLYRQWGGKQTLVVDALEATRPYDEVATIDTGSLRTDLHEWVRVSLAAPLTDVGLVHAIIHACTGNPELAAAMRERMNLPEDPFNRLFAKAAERGEIEPDAPAIPYVQLVLAGPYILREFIEEQPPDEEYLIGLVESVVVPALGIS